MSLQFLSLASGSSGNCYYLGNEEYGILIDAGKGVRTIKKVLKEYGIPFEKIVALCGGINGYAVFLPPRPSRTE